MIRYTDKKKKRQFSKKITPRNLAPMLRSRRAKPSTFYTENEVKINCEFIGYFYTTLNSVLMGITGHGSIGPDQTYLTTAYGLENSASFVQAQSRYNYFRIDKIVITGVPTLSTVTTSKIYGDGANAYGAPVYHILWQQHVAYTGQANYTACKTSDRTKRFSAFSPLRMTMDLKRNVGISPDCYGTWCRMSDSPFVPGQIQIYSGNDVPATGVSHPLAITVKYYCSFKSLKV